MSDEAHRERTAEPPIGRWDPDGIRRIREIPRVDRPREKLIAKGSEALSDVELLAVLLGSGTRRLGVLDLSARILRKHGGSLHRIDVDSLCRVQGIGPAKACQIAAALELARRHITKARTTLRTAGDALPYLREIRDRKQEHFVVLSLSGANEVIASRVATVGLLDMNQVHPREVFADPIADRAAAVIVAHNHPSGTLEASPEDIALTRRLVKAGDILGIRVLDHLIVTADGYLSMKQEGAM